MSKGLPIVAKNIKKCRAKLGISHHTIAKIESGATPNPSIETVMKIASALKC